MVWKLRLNSICITVQYSARTGGSITHIWTTSHIYEQHPTYMGHAFFMHIIVWCCFQGFDIAIQICLIMEHINSMIAYIRYKDRTWTLRFSHTHCQVIAHGRCNIEHIYTTHTCLHIYAIIGVSVWGPGEGC